MCDTFNFVCVSDSAKGTDIFHKLLSVPFFFFRFISYQLMNMEESATASATTLMKAERLCLGDDPGESPFGNLV